MTAPRKLVESPRWFWIAAIWSGIGLSDATQTVFVMRAEGMHHFWIRLFFTLLFSWLPWALATPLVLRLVRQYPAAHWRRISIWLTHVGACAAIGVVYAGWMAVWEEWLNPWALSPGPDPFAQLWLRKFNNGLLSYLILYGVILLVGSMLDSRERLARQQAETARLNEQLSQAQLNALRRQIEPHFLFNTLNAIAGLVREKRNDAAVDMIAGLSDFLRRVVEESGRQQVPLGEELDFARKYLDIQKVRFAERLQVSVECSQRTLSRSGAEPDPAAHGRKRGQTWHRETRAGRGDPDCRVALQRQAHSQCLQRRSRPACGLGEVSYWSRNLQCADAPSEPLRRRVRPEHAESESVWRGSFGFGALRFSGPRRVIRAHYGTRFKERALKNALWNARQRH
jgi:Histidine kinase